MTPDELQRIGIRMYGRRHWRSKLALNLGKDTATVHRWARRETIDYVVEVAVRGLLERHKVNVIAEKAVRERLRKEGKLRPVLRARKKKKKLPEVELKAEDA